jgi:hypothetical protein
VLGKTGLSLELWLRYPDHAALAADFEANLTKGRAFVAGEPALAERETCTVVVEHPETGECCRIAAEAVWLSRDPNNLGTGVQFVPFERAQRDTLAWFVASRAAPSPPSAGESPPATPLPDSDPDELSASSSGTHRNLYDRVRSLTLEQRAELARQGTLPERVALERAFGGSLWEALLQNPTITVREVARMAKSGSLPTSLISLIVQNRAWLADSGVQAALLNNPRVSGAQLERVLRTLPQAELARVATQTSYRLLVRTAAKRLIVR